MGDSRTFGVLLITIYMVIKPGYFKGTQNQITKGCSHGGILRGVSLQGGTKKHNTTLLGKASTMDQCIKKCCRTGSCDLVLLTGDECQGIQCGGESTCQIVHVNQETVKSEIAFITKDDSLASQALQSTQKEIEKRSQIRKRNQLFKMERTKSSTTIKHQSDVTKHDSLSSSVQAYHPLLLTEKGQQEEESSSVKKAGIPVPDTDQLLAAEWGVVARDPDDDDDNPDTSLDFMGNGKKASKSSLEKDDEASAAGNEGKKEQSTREKIERDSHSIVEDFMKDVSSKSSLEASPMSSRDLIQSEIGSLGSAGDTISSGHEINNFQSSFGAYDGSSGGGESAVQSGAGNDGKAKLIEALIKKSADDESVAFNALLPTSGNTKKIVNYNNDEGSTNEDSISNNESHDHKSLTEPRPSAVWHFSAPVMGTEEIKENMREAKASSQTMKLGSSTKHTSKLPVLKEAKISSQSPNASAMPVYVQVKNISKPLPDSQVSIKKAEREEPVATRSDNTTKTFQNNKPYTKPTVAANKSVILKLPTVRSHPSTKPFPKNTAKVTKSLEVVKHKNKVNMNTKGNDVINKGDISGSGFNWSYDLNNLNSDKTVKVQGSGGRAPFTGNVQNTTYHKLNTQSFKKITKVKGSGGSSKFSSRVKSNKHVKSNKRVKTKTISLTSKPKSTTKFGVSHTLKKAATGSMPSWNGAVGSGPQSVPHYVQNVATDKSQSSMSSSVPLSVPSSKPSSKKNVKSGNAQPSAPNYAPNVATGNLLSSLSSSVPSSMSSSLQSSVPSTNDAKSGNSPPSALHYVKNAKAGKSFSSVSSSVPSFTKNVPVDASSPLSYSAQNVPVNASPPLSFSAQNVPVNASPPLSYSAQNVPVSNLASSVPHVVQDVPVQNLSSSAHNNVYQGQASAASLKTSSASTNTFRNKLAETPYKNSPISKFTTPVYLSYQPYNVSGVSTPEANTMLISDMQPNQDDYDMSGSGEFPEPQSPSYSQTTQGVNGTPSVRPSGANFPSGSYQPFKTASGLPAWVQNIQLPTPSAGAAKWPTAANQGPQPFNLQSMPYLSGQNGSDSDFSMQMAASGMYPQFSPDGRYEDEFLEDDNTTLQAPVAGEQTLGQYGGPPGQMANRWNLRVQPEEWNDNASGMYAPIAGSPGFPQGNTNARQVSGNGLPNEDYPASGMLPSSQSQYLQNQWNPQDYNGYQMTAGGNWVPVQNTQNISQSFKGANGVFYGNYYDWMGSKVSKNGLQDASGVNGGMGAAYGEGAQYSRPYGKEMTAQDGLQQYETAFNVESSGLGPSSYDGSESKLDLMGNANMPSGGDNYYGWKKNKSMEMKTGDLKPPKAKDENEDESDQAESDQAESSKTTAKWSKVASAKGDQDDSSNKPTGTSKTTGEKILEKQSEASVGITRNNNSPNNFYWPYYMMWKSNQINKHEKQKTAKSGASNIPYYVPDSAFDNDGLSDQYLNGISPFYENDESVQEQTQTVLNPLKKHKKKSKWKSGRNSSLHKVVKTHSPTQDATGMKEQETTHLESVSQPSSETNKTSGGQLGDYSMAPDSIVSSPLGKISGSEGLLMTKNNHSGTEYDESSQANNGLVIFTGEPQVRNKAKTRVSSVRKKVKLIGSGFHSDKRKNDKGRKVANPTTEQSRKTDNVLSTIDKLESVHDKLHDLRKKVENDKLKFEGPKNKVKEKAFDTPANKAEFRKPVASPRDITLDQKYAQVKNESLDLIRAWELYRSLYERFNHHKLEQDMPEATSKSTTSSPTTTPTATTTTPATTTVTIPTTTPFVHSFNNLTLNKTMREKEEKSYDRLVKKIHEHVRKVLKHFRNKFKGNKKQQQQKKKQKHREQKHIKKVHKIPLPIKLGKHIKVHRGRHMQVTSIKRKMHHRNKAAASKARTVENPFKCPIGATIRGETVRGGMLSGEFKTVGKLENHQQCVRACCNAPGCNVALSLGSECLNVHCYDTNLCRFVPAGSILNISPEVTYARRPLHKRSTDELPDNDTSEQPEADEQTEHDPAESLALLPFFA